MGWLCAGLFAAFGIYLIVSALKRLAPRASDEIEIEAKYRSRCITCHQTCTPGDRILWHRRLKTVRHSDCQAGAKTRLRDVVVTTIDKIAGAGPGTRKTAIASALAQLPPSSPERQEFLIEVARLDVNETLDKVDSLKSVAAKKRHLNAALARLEGDEVPDELQTEQFKWIRETLAMIEDPLSQPDLPPRKRSRDDGHDDVPL